MTSDESSTSHDPQALAAFAAEVKVLFPLLGELRAELMFQGQMACEDQEFIKRFKEVSNTFSTYAEISSLNEVSTYANEVVRLCEILQEPKVPRPASLSKIFNKACEQYIAISESISQEKPWDEIAAELAPQFKLVHQYAEKLEMVKLKMQTASTIPVETATAVSEEPSVEQGSVSATPEEAVVSLDEPSTNSVAEVAPLASSVSVPVKDFYLAYRAKGSQPSDWLKIAVKDIKSIEYHGEGQSTPEGQWWIHIDSGEEDSIVVMADEIGACTSEENAQVTPQLSAA